MKKIILFLVLAVLVFGCPQPAEITNFEGCVAAGNPAMESYPRKCRAGDRTFTEVIAGVNSDIELSYSTGAAHLDWGTYYLEVGSDGKAMFTKSAGPGEKSYDFSVSAAELEKIYETAESEGFFFLQDNYTDPSIMDGGWSSITISGRGNSKTVGVTNYSLPAFEEVETEIARLILSKIGDDAFSLKDLEENAEVKEAKEFSAEYCDLLANRAECVEHCSETICAEGLCEALLFEAEGCTTCSAGCCSFCSDLDSCADQGSCRIAWIHPSGESWQYGGCENMDFCIGVEGLCQYISTSYQGYGYTAAVEEDSEKAEVYAGMADALQDLYNKDCG